MFRPPVPKGFWGRDGWRGDVRRAAARGRDAWHRTRPAVHRGASGDASGPVRAGYPMEWDIDPQQRLDRGRLDLVDGDLVFRVGRHGITWSLTGRGRARPVVSAVLWAPETPHEPDSGPGDEPAPDVAQVVLLDTDGVAVWRIALSAWSPVHPDDPHVLLASTGLPGLLDRAGLTVVDAVERPTGLRRAGWVAPRMGRSVRPAVDALAVLATVVVLVLLDPAWSSHPADVVRDLTATEVVVVDALLLAVTVPFAIASAVASLRTWRRRGTVVGVRVGGPDGQDALARDLEGDGGLVVLRRGAFVRLPPHGPGAARGLRLTLHRSGRRGVVDRVLDVVVEPDGGRVPVDVTWPLSGDADGALTERSVADVARAVDLPVEVVRRDGSRGRVVPAATAVRSPRGGRAGWSFARLAVGAFVPLPALLTLLEGSVPWSTVLLAVVGLGVVNGVTGWAGLRRGTWARPRLEMLEPTSE